MPRDAYSFVVRIWREAADSADTPGVWRGSIHDVANDERSYFSELDDIGRIIRRQMQLAGQVAASSQEGKVDQAEA